MSTINTPILLTGRPGIGKSTTIRRIFSSMDASRVTAIFSSEIRENGLRQGFQIEVPATGECGLLASPTVESDVRFGTVMPDGRHRLGVTFEFLEEVAVPVLQAGIDRSDFMVIDEIGPMQASSKEFRGVIDQIIENRTPLLASIAQSDDDWIRALREESKAAVLVLDRNNRDLITDTLACYLVNRDLKGITTSDPAAFER